jgi:RimJ/RimL family protein N-acetyltransferase
MTSPFPASWRSPEPRSFQGRYLALQPLVPERDAGKIFQLTHASDAGRALWRYLPRGPFADADDLRRHLEEWQAQPGTVQFLVTSPGSGETIGSISLMRITPQHGVAELGYVWYIPSMQRTKVNTETNYLLLRYCFEELGYRRMEWKCDDRNEPSRRAALRLGFLYEGTFRQHMVVRGENRDTAWFSMLDSEWSRRRANLERWLYEDDSVSLSVLNA